MATDIATFGELTAMPLEDLRKEITQKRSLVRKMRLGIQMNKEKDSARYRREKRGLARMLTALQALEENGVKVLKPKPKTRTVPSPSKL